MSTHAKQRPPVAGEYARMVWDRRWLIMVMMVAGLALALVTRPTTAPVAYEATVPVEVRSLTLDGTTSATSTLFRVPAAEVEAARSIEVAASVAEELGMNDGGAALLDRLTVEPVEDAPVIYLTLTGEGPETVAELETYAQNYVEFRKDQDQVKIDEAVGSIDTRIDRLERRLNVLSLRLERESNNNEGVSSPLTSTQFQAVSDLYREHVALREEIVLSSALADTRFRTLSAPFSQQFDPIPTGTLRLFLFPLAGALLGVAIALTLGVLRPKLYGRYQIEELAVPLLATIPKVATARAVRRQPLLVQRTSAWGAESFGILRAELHMEAARAGSGEMRVVAIASAAAGEGKSTISTNLAASYATSGMRTVLFRADVADTRGRPRRRRRGASGFEPKAPSPPMKKRSDPAGFDEIFLMPGEGGWRQEVIVQAIARLEHDYDIVVIDTPPLLHTADALVLTAEAEAAVLVVRQGVTLQDEAASALELLRRHDVNVVGVVLNGQVAGRLTGDGRAQRYSGSRGRPAPTGADLHPYGMNGHDRESQPVATRGDGSAGSSAPQPVTTQPPPDPDAISAK